MGKRNNSFSGIMTGAMLIIVGVIWVLTNYGLINISIWKLWPLVVIFVGISILLKEKQLNNPIALTMIILGFSFLIANLRIIKGWNWYHAVNLWPVALIIIGISILVKRADKQNESNNSSNNNE